MNLIELQNKIVEMGWWDEPNHLAPLYVYSTPSYQKQWRETVRV